MTAPDGTAPQDQAEARPSFGRIAWTVLRVVVSVAVLVAVYYLLPLDHVSTPVAVTILLIGLAGFIALVAFQVRLIIRSPFPTLRAVESLATGVPLFLLLFAGTYVVMAALSADNFGGHLSHTDGLYFTVTVFSTVGFGDITAKIETARLVVTGQMIADLIILGVAIKVNARGEPLDAIVLNQFPELRQDHFEYAPSQFRGRGSSRVGARACGFGFPRS